PLAAIPTYERMRLGARIEQSATQLVDLERARHAEPRLAQQMTQQVTLPRCTETLESRARHTAWHRDHARVLGRHRGQYLFGFGHLRGESAHIGDGRGPALEQRRQHRMTQEI